MHSIVPKNNNKMIAAWLLMTALCIIAIIFIGGVTRLTGSGLSIVEWRPVTGIMPPLSHDTWLEEFNKYKEFSEYKIVNFHMNLVEFKFIYLLEYFHRLIARLLGLVLLLPFIYFSYKKMLDTKTQKNIFIIILLVALQGLIGWLMVKSGLGAGPHVSHFRLALHLATAIFIYSLVLNQLYNLTVQPSYSVPANLLIFFKVGLLFTYLQIISGALVAGLKAGLIYNNFPLMDHYFIAEELWLNEGSLNLYNPAFVQLIHRIIACILTITLIALIIQIVRTNRRMVNIAGMILVSIILQFTLGIVTLLYNVPITFAALHQLGAILVVTILIYGIKTIKNIKKL